jgi:K+-sensing histidine kinase KdpD
VSVIDTGVGIREEDQAQLFIAFGKGNSDENKTLNKQGVGLGLLISNMIMKTINNSEKGLYFETAVGLGFKSSSILGTRFSFIIERAETLSVV